MVTGAAASKVSDPNRGKMAVLENRRAMGHDQMITETATEIGMTIGTTGNNKTTNPSQLKSKMLSFKAPQLKAQKIRARVIGLRNDLLISVHAIPIRGVAVTIMMRITGLIWLKIAAGKTAAGTAVLGINLPSKNLGMLLPNLPAW